MWDERYDEGRFAYGDAPNDFLVESADLLARGNCLCLAEGQGRNAAWLAGHGWDVTAMDQSAVGMARARDLALSRGVTLRTEVGDLDDYDLGTDRWNTIVSIFGHVPSVLRRSVHRRVVEALAPGGTFLLEAYTPAQLDAPGTGGPSDADMMPTEADLHQELAGLDFLVSREVMREVNEGEYHHGESAVVQIVARKPKGD